MSWSYRVKRTVCGLCIAAVREGADAGRRCYRIGRTVRAYGTVWEGERAVQAFRIAIHM